jgi:NAD(P)H-dependent FMN reductase
MKITLINSSPQKNGVTFRMLSEMQGAISPNHSVESFDVYRMIMKPCSGCLKCRPDRPCVMPRDDAHALGERISESDIIIIGAPVYWGNIPGPLKTFFDRNVTTFEYCEARPMKIPVPRLKGKKAILVLSSASPFPYNQLGSQSRGAVRALKTVLNAGGVRVIKIVNIPNSYAFEKKKERYLETARRIGAGL